MYMPVTWIVGSNQPSVGDQMAACIFSDLSWILVLTVKEFVRIAIATGPSSGDLCIVTIFIFFERNHNDM